MPFFRKKPVRIEARQWDGTLPSALEIVGWSAGQVGVGIDHRVLLVDTAEGTMTAQPGDWLIWGVKGEFYPCKPDIFEMTYEAVD